MALSAKSALEKFLATADCLIQFEATVNAPRAYPPVKSVTIISIHCGKR